MEVYAQENGYTWRIDIRRRRRIWGYCDTDTTSSVGDTGESYNMSDILSSAHTRSRSLPPSPTHSLLHSLPPPPARTRSHGKAKRRKDREHPYKGFGVVYLPGDINGLTKKLHLLAAEFFAGNTTVMNELLRLKQLTGKEYTDIIARLAASLCLYTRVDVLQWEDTSMEDLEL